MAYKNRKSNVKQYNWQVKCFFHVLGIFIAKIGRPLSSRLILLEDTDAIGSIFIAIVTRYIANPTLCMRIATSSMRIAIRQMAIFVGPMAICMATMAIGLVDMGIPTFCVSANLITFNWQSTNCEITKKLIETNVLSKRNKHQRNTNLLKKIGIFFDPLSVCYHYFNLFIPRAAQTSKSMNNHSSKQKLWPGASLQICFFDYDYCH